jgi:hypothetical protein
MDRRRQAGAKAAFELLNPLSPLALPRYPPEGGLSLPTDNQELKNAFEESFMKAGKWRDSGKPPKGRIAAEATAGPFRTV